MEVSVMYKAPKTVVITGAASGLGRAFSLAWAERGWKVGILDIDMEGAEETCKMVADAGGTGEAFSCNVRRLEEVEAAAEHFYNLWGEVGVLVNNAGVGGGGAVGEIPIEHWEIIIETDLWGVVYGCHTFIPRMKAQGGGHIVNVASAAGLFSAPRFAPYNMSKAAVVSLSQTLKSELAPFDIGVTVVCPPVVKTEIVDNTLEMAGKIDYDIEHEVKLLKTALDNSRITPGYVAEKTIKAVGKNRLYVIPGVSLHLSWFNSRYLPSFFYGLMAFLTRRGLDKPVFMYTARKGYM
jgi:NAD(P)-dependent dehydrogenase (short-subunit alcohol dehydrogenase family)